MNVINLLMGFPRLYTAVQNTIAGPAHQAIKASIGRELPDETGIAILDLGCGVGDYSELLKCATYTGMDLDENYIQSAMSNYGREGITFVAGDAARIPFSDRHFDYCFSIGLYHHLPDGAVVASLREALRVTGPGRVLIFDAIYPPSGNYIGLLLRRLDRGKFVRTFSAYERLLRDNFSVLEISAQRAGLLDYISYRI